MKKKTTEFTLIAKTLFGLEEVLAQELLQLGARDIQVLNRAVSFTGDQYFMYKANLQLRTAVRILKPIHSFKAHNEAKLYQGVRQVDWSQYMDVHGTLAVDSALSSDFFNHSQYTSLKTKDAIVDQFRDKTGSRPSVELNNPTLRINLHIFKDECTLSLDSSGDSLHKRGYRQDINPAPLSEVLAAGMILLTGWDGQSNFMDPMCGSGTLLIEAAMYALNIPPGIHRSLYGFMNWSDFDSEMWENVRTKAIGRIREHYPYTIAGSDIDAETIEIAMRNIEAAMLDEDIRLAVRPFEQQSPPEGGGLVVFNPPYGERMQKEDINGFYQMIGDRLKQAYSGYDAWMLTSNMEALKHVGLRPSRKIPLLNGPLECRFVKYSMYSGSKKSKYNNPDA